MISKFSLYNMWALFLLTLNYLSFSVEGCADPISCALENIYIQLPDIALPISGSNYLYLSNLACYGVNIDSLPSQYLSPTTVSFGMSGFRLTCSGDYIYTVFHGTMTALIKNTDLAIDFDLKKEGELPVLMNFTKCSFPSIFVDVSFTGGVGTNILNLLSTAVETFLIKALDIIVCSKLADFVYINGTQALVNTIDPALLAIMSTQPSISPVLPYPTINWNKSLFGLLYRFMDSGLADHVRECALERFPELQFPLINNFINLITDGTGVIDIPVNSVLPVLNGTFTISTVSLVGLNTFQSIGILKPSAVSNITLSTSLGLDEFDVIINCTIAADPSKDYYEDLQIRLKLKDIVFAIDLDVGVNTNMTGDLYLDQFDIGCIMQGIGYVNISSLGVDISIDQIALIDVSGGAAQLEKDFTSLIDNIFLLLTSGYGDLVRDVLHGVFQGPIRHVINEKITANFEASRANSTCSPHVPVLANASSPILWYNSSLINMIDNIVNVKVGAEGVNQLMNCITNNTGEIVFNRPRWSIAIRGLNSFFNLTLLAPMSGELSTSHPYNLENSIGLGHCVGPKGGADCKPFSIYFASMSNYADAVSEAVAEGVSFLETLQLINDPAYVDIISHDLSQFLIAKSEAMESSALVSLDEDVLSVPAPSLGGFVPAGTTISLELENFQLYLNLFAMMNKAILSSLQVQQTHVDGCVASSFYGLAVDALTLSLSNASLVVDDGKYKRDLTKGISAFLNILTRESKIEKTNANLDDKVTNSAEVCANGGVMPFVSDDAFDQSSPSTWKWEITLLIAGCVASLGILLFVYYYWGRTGKVRCSRTNTGKYGVVGDQFSSPLLEEDEDNRHWWDRWGWDDALITQVRLPRLLRVGIPLAILGNMAMFLNSNLEPAAVVVIAELDIGPKVATPPPIFNFGLRNTVEDMWNAEVYALAILIAFFSGLWPYVKLAVMFVCWTMPSGAVSISRRESMLKAMDILGKWSLIDFFVMVMMMCAFMFHLALADNLVVDVTVVPHWGFYGFLLATMISLGLGHIILACHRLIVEPKVPAIPNQYATKESVLDHVFRVHSRMLPNFNSISVPSVGEAEHGSMNKNRIGPNSLPNIVSNKIVFVKASRLAKAVVVITLLATAVLLYLGTTINTFQFDFKGLTGLLLKDAAFVDYSFTTVGTSVPEASGKPNDFAVRWMEVCYFAFGIGMPAGMIAVVSIMWVIPLSLSRQRLMLVIAEVLNAWSALDVFVISILAALLEIQQFAAFIVGDKCDGINTYLENIDQLLDGDDKCFDVVATLKSDAWILFLAAGMLIIVGIPSLTISNWAIKDRIEHNKMVYTHSSNSLAARNPDDILISVANQKSDEVIAAGAVICESDDMGRLSEASIAQSCDMNTVPGAGAGGVRFQSTENPIHREGKGPHVRADEDESTRPLSSWEHVQSFFLTMLYYCGLLIVVDPADVRGLEALGLGVADAISQSSRFSSANFARGDSATAASGVNSALALPQGTNSYADDDEETLGSSQPVF